MNMLATFQDEWKNWPTKPVKLAESLLKLVPGMKMYSTYVNRYDEANQLLATLQKKAPIKAIFDEVQKRPSVRNMPIEMCARLRNNHAAYILMMFSTCLGI
jgi:hypothetical protein